MVARPRAGRVSFLVAQVLGHLGLQRTLQDQLHQPGEQTALAHQLEPVPSGPFHQLLGQVPVLLSDPRQLRPRPHLVLALNGARFVLAAHL
nr:hypothetical protein [Streptomyces sp. RLB1-33]